MVLKKTPFCHLENCFSSSCLSLRFSFPFGKLLYTLTPCCSFIHSGITGTALLYIESATARQADAIQLWNFFLAHRTHLNLYRNSKIQGSSHFLLFSSALHSHFLRTPALESSASQIRFSLHLQWTFSSVPFSESILCCFSAFLFGKAICNLSCPFLKTADSSNGFSSHLRSLFSFPVIFCLTPRKSNLTSGYLLCLPKFVGFLNSCSCLALLYSIRFVMSIGFSKKFKKFFVICF